MSQEQAWGTPARTGRGPNEPDGSELPNGSVSAPVTAENAEAARPATTATSPEEGTEGTPEKNKAPDPKHVGGNTPTRRTSHSRVR